MAEYDQQSEFVMVSLEREKLERARLRRGLTRMEVAAAAHIARGTAKRVFRRQPVRLRVARAVANVMGISLEELIDMDEAVAMAVGGR